MSHQCCISPNRSHWKPPLPLSEPKDGSGPQLASPTWVRFPQVCLWPRRIPIGTQSTRFGAGSVERMRKFFSHSSRNGTFAVSSEIARFMSHPRICSRVASESGSFTYGQDIQQRSNSQTSSRSGMLNPWSIGVNYTPSALSVTRIFPLFLSQLSILRSSKAIFSTWLFGKKLVPKSSHVPECSR
jgi:hypothetical protein